MIYLFLAEGFEEIEALCPLDILRRAGADIKTVSVCESPYVTGAHGITVKADISASELDLEALDAVLLPGGMPGTLNLDASEAVHAAIDRAVGENKLIAAICAAPMILGKKGLLRGKRAICYPGFEKYLEDAVIARERVVKDGNIITAAGMGVAHEFGLEVLRTLFSPEKADEIKTSIIM